MAIGRYIANLHSLQGDKSSSAKFIIGLFTLILTIEFSILSTGFTKMHFAIVSLIIITLFSYIFWEKAVAALVIWSIISGAIRKWVLPESADLIFFFNHIILTGIYLRFFGDFILKRTKSIPAHPINKYLILYIGWAMLCALNPFVGDLRVGILGLIIYFYYVPIAYILPYIFTSKEILIKYLKLFAIISLPCLILGIIQYFSPANSPINRYVISSIQEIATAGTAVRITSTFSFIGGYASYLSILIPVLVYLLSTHGYLSKQFKSFLYFLTIIAVINLSMTGSRGAFFSTLFSVIVFLSYTGVINRQIIKRNLPGIIIVIILSIPLIFADISKTTFVNLIERGGQSQDILPRIISTYTRPFFLVKLVGVYGLGIGSTYQGVRAFNMRSEHFIQRFTGGIEPEPERILVEIGAFGLIIAFAIRFLFIKYFFNLFKSLTSPETKGIALIALLFQIQFSLGLQLLVFNHTSHLYYWFTIGFLFLLKNIDTVKENYENG